MLSYKCREQLRAAAPHRRVRGQAAQAGLNA
jgi:hypothetical protein